MFFPPKAAGRRLERRSRVAALAAFVTIRASLVCNKQMLECSWVTEFDSMRVERFKQSTKEKLRGLRCPDHRQPPRLHFSGCTLRDVTISMSGCCEKLMEMANARIALAAPEADIRKPA